MEWMTLAVHGLVTSLNPTMHPAKLQRPSSAISFLVFHEQSVDLLRDLEEKGIKLVYFIDDAALRSRSWIQDVTAGYFPFPSTCCTLLVYQVQSPLAYADL